MKLTLDEVAMPLHDDMRILRRVRKGRIVSYLKYIAYEDAWLLTEIFTHPTYRGKGHASSLLDELLQKSMEEIDEMPVVLRVAASEFSGMNNDQLYAWYQRHGFKDHGAWGRYGLVMVSW